MNLYQLQNTLNTLQPNNASDYTEAHRLLTSIVQQWIEEDFARLVQVLYRMDVEEAKVKAALKENKERDAAAVIAELILQRHLEKLQTKAENIKPSPPSGEERW